MYIRSLISCAALLTLLAWGGCKSSEQGQKPGKWIPFPEQTALKEQALRRSLKVMKREAMSNTTTDSGEVWYPSEIILYNTYGQPTLIQAIDPSGKVTKETRYTYRDTLVLQEDVTESTGYSSSLHYGYDAQGRKEYEVLFHRGDSVLKRRYELDSYGNEVKVHLHRHRDGADLELDSQRDELGRPTTVKEIQAGQTNWTEVYALSDTLWRIKRTNAKGELQSDYSMRFDKNKAIVQMINLSPEGKPRLTVNYENDSQGRMLVELYLGGDNQPMQRSDFRYDKNGLLVEKSISAPGSGAPFVTRYSYVYQK